jgi:hypothetical protein
VSTSLAALSADELSTLSVYEGVIRQGLESFVEVGNALARIRDGRLYRAEFKTFEEYCQTRWNLDKRYANRLVVAANVVEDLGPIGPKPKTESQVRQLVKLPKEERPKAWKESVETAPKDATGNPKITAKHVEQVVAAKIDKPAKVESQPADECPHGGEHKWATDDRGDQYCDMCYEDRPLEMCKPKPAAKPSGIIAKVKPIWDQASDAERVTLRAWINEQEID